MSESIPSPALVLDLDEDSIDKTGSSGTAQEKIEIIEKIEAPKYQKPKVALNENNLLSGFMMEFGLNIASKASPAQVTVSS